MEEIIQLISNESTETVAKFLLGMYLEQQTEFGCVGGYIVDVEAYLGPEDKAAHSFGLKNTPRLKAMYDKPGTIYLYTMHRHLLLNIVTQAIGKPQGVMIRALQPVDGIALMERNRQGKTGVELTNGPGKLTSAMGISSKSYGCSIFEGGLRIVPKKRRWTKKIVAVPRIGIPNKGIWTDKPLRYYVAGNPFVFKQKKSDIESRSLGWKDEKDEKRNNANLS